MAAAKKISPPHDPAQLLHSLQHAYLHPTLRWQQELLDAKHNKNLNDIGDDIKDQPHQQQQQQQQQQRQGEEHSPPHGNGTLLTVNTRHKRDNEVDDDMSYRDLEG
jgi:hypothetical protein